MSAEWSLWLLPVPALRMAAGPGSTLPTERRYEERKERKAKKKRKKT